MVRNFLTFVGLAVAFCLAPRPSFGTVVTNTTCTASFLISSNSTTGPTSCGASAVIPDHPEVGIGGSNASISNTTTLSGSFSSTFSYQVFAQVVEGSAAATVSGNNTVQLSSGGHARPGFLSITEDYFEITGLSVDTNTTVTIGSYSQTCTQSTFGNPPAICNVAPQRPTDTVILPFTLGQAFTFSHLMTSSASVGNGTIPHYADAQLKVTFSLLEADPGSTNLHSVPVVLADAPEPQSFALIGSGLIGLLIARKRMRRNS